jgi:hypothetical protein
MVESIAVSLPDSLLQVMGRPIVLTDAVVRTLERCFRKGVTDTEACNHAGIARSTLNKYRKKYPEFSDIIDGWKTEPVTTARQVLIDDLSDSKSQTRTSSARYLIDKHDGLARKNVHIEQDVTFTVVRKTYAPVPVEGETLATKALTDEAEALRPAQPDDAIVDCAVEGIESD